MKKNKIFVGLTGGYASGKSTVLKIFKKLGVFTICLLYTSPSPRDRTRSRMPSSA